MLSAPLKCYGQAGMCRAPPDTGASILKHIQLRYMEVGRTPA